MFKSKTQETQTNKHYATQACHIYAIVRKHTILQDCQQWDKCMCILNVCESVIPNVWTTIQGHTYMNYVCVR